MTQKIRRGVKIAVEHRILQERSLPREVDVPLSRLLVGIVVPDKTKAKAQRPTKCRPSSHAPDRAPQPPQQGDGAPLVVRSIDVHLWP
ncbi:hypothetical protein [Variovorax sp.]|uniref:hypothetical protein n=1 Tax=Variovorax sp. TaxID=1871043 RepID=UPI0037D9D9F3